MRYVGISVMKKKPNSNLIIIAYTSGNIDFFIDKDYKKDVGNIQDSEYILNKINILRDPVRDMEKEDQNKVIKYIQNLSKLCDAYHNK